jgi:hypothetical protein
MVQQVIEGGDARQVKQLLQAYVEGISVVSQDEIYPRFAVPAVVSPPYPSVGGTERCANRPEIIADLLVLTSGRAQAAAPWARGTPRSGAS